MKRNIAKEFRNEYYASLHYPEHIAELKLKLQELDASMDVHSPNLDGMHYAPVDRDTRLADYAVRREKIMNDIRRMESQLARIQGVMAFMDDPIKSMFIDSYSGKMNVEAAAYRHHYDPRAARRAIDREIRNSIEMYEDLGFIDDDEK